MPARPRTYLPFDINRPPMYCDVLTFCATMGISRAMLFKLRLDGKIKMKCFGKKNLVDVASGLKYMQSLPDWPK
ncbi:hypothetical protein QD460_23835 [Rhizobium jaguaris]|uniref:hypothetical protein n=1 Tax=Rhizobium jaguaris TaxID=1312183 RepID=UPI0039BED4B6